LKKDRQSRLLPVWDYAATSARSALEGTRDERRLDGRRATVPNLLPGPLRTGSALLDHVRDSVHKSFPNPDRAMAPATAIWALAFKSPGESRKPDWNPGMADVRQAR